MTAQHWTHTGWRRIVFSTVTSALDPMRPHITKTSRVQLMATALSNRTMVFISFNSHHHHHSHLGSNANANGPLNARMVASGFAWLDLVLLYAWNVILTLWEWSNRPVEGGMPKWFTHFTLPFSSSVWAAFTFGQGKGIFPRLTSRLPGHPLWFRFPVQGGQQPTARKWKSLQSRPIAGIAHFRLFPINYIKNKLNLQWNSCCFGQSCCSTHNSLTAAQCPFSLCWPPRPDFTSISTEQMHQSKEGRRQAIDSKREEKQTGIWNIFTKFYELPIPQTWLIV